MQHVSEKWLKRLNIIYLSYSFFLIACYLFFAIKQDKPIITPPHFWGISISSGLLTLTAIIYRFTLFKPVRRKNTWLAYTVIYLLVNVANASMTEVTDLASSQIVLSLITSVFVVMSVSLGPIAGISVVGIIGVITSMIVAGTTTPTALGVNGDIVVFVVRATLIFLGIYLLRNSYVSTDDSKSGYIDKYFTSNKVVGLLTNSISDGVLILDKNQVIKTVNPAVLTILNQSADDIADLNYRSVLELKHLNGSKLTEEDDPVLKALRLGKSINQELLLQNKKQTDFMLDITVSVISDEFTHEVYGTVIIMRDISNKKREESARSDFISTASHEMRTPVAAIEGYIELALNEKVSTIDANARKYLEKANFSAQHLSRLFQDLLVTAKAEDGRINNNPTMTEISKLLEQQAEMSSMAAKQKGLNFEFAVSSSDKSNKKSNGPLIRPLYYAMVDPDRIREVVSNLVDNAIKYTQTGKITLGVTGNEDVVQFFIKDTGVGMSQEDTKHLFQKFYRVDNSDTRTTGGTGLGLFISKEIIKLYKGQIWVESERGVGTTFYVNIPRMTASEVESNTVLQKNNQLGQVGENNSGK